MASSPNFDLKEQLNISFKDTEALSSLCRNIASGTYLTKKISLKHFFMYLCYNIEELIVRDTKIKIFILKYFWN